MSEDEKFEATPPDQHPVGRVHWVHPTELFSNSYNPNKVFPAELELLKKSILEDGFTQPAVIKPTGEIVDGFHRWTLCSRDEEVQATLPDGKMPVVILRAGKTKADQQISTVRHNRARGQHGILKMGQIVRDLEKQGLSDEEIMDRLGMEDEELYRLRDLRGSPELVGKDSFGKGWVPVDRKKRVDRKL